MGKRSVARLKQARAFGVGFAARKPELFPPNDYCGSLGLRRTVNRFAFKREYLAALAT